MMARSMLGVTSSAYIMHYAVGIAGCAANGLDKACLTAKEALFVGIQDGNQRNFRQVETLTQQIDAHNDIEWRPRAGL